MAASLHSDDVDSGNDDFGCTRRTDKKLSLSTSARGRKGNSINAEIDQVPEDVEVPSFEKRASSEAATVAPKRSRGCNDLNKSQSRSDFPMFGLKWRGNSCAMDTIATALLYIFQEWVAPNSSAEHALYSLSPIIKRLRELVQNPGGYPNPFVVAREQI